MSTLLQSRPGGEPGTSPGRSPAPGRRRIGLMPVLLLVGIVVSGWAASYIGFAPQALVDGWANMVRLVERMLPPTLDEPARTSDLALQTLLMAVLGTVLATVASVPIAFMAAKNTSPNAAVQAVARGIITFCRAMPDLLFAVLLVRALGIGVLPGILALALHSIGMLGKLFADAIEESSADPVEAMRSAGAGYFRQMVNGVVPKVIPSWIGSFIYRIDINLRTSVVLGMVGAGGIGFALQDALRGLDYAAALGIVAVVLVIIAAMELLAIVVRRLLLVPKGSHPRRDTTARFGFSVLLGGFTLAGFWQLSLNPIDLFTWVGPTIRIFGRLLPPDFTAFGPQLWESMGQTLAIGVVATAVGIVLSLPVGICAANGVAPNAMVYWLARAVVLVVRAVPELILAVIFVAALGLGPVAGACALSIASIGFFAKLVADAAEKIDRGPIEAVRSTGGGWWKVLFAAVLPQAMPSIVGSGLYLLDVNIRTSTILGVVGAGGVGYMLVESIRTLNFQGAGAIVLLIFVVVFVIEQFSGWVRKRLV